MWRYHLIGDRQPLPQEGGDYFHNGLVKLRESLQLLQDKTLGVWMCVCVCEEKIDTWSLLWQGWLPVCCSYCSAGWSSASPRGPAPRSANWAPPDVSPASSPTARRKSQAQTGTDAGPEGGEGGSCRLAIITRRLYILQKKVMFLLFCSPAPLMMWHLRDNTAALTVAFLMAVRMSMVLSPPRGSTDSNVLPKVSWNM